MQQVGFTADDINKVIIEITCLCNAFLALQEHLGGCFPWTAIISECVQAFFGSNATVYVESRFLEVTWTKVKLVNDGIY